MPTHRTSHEPLSLRRPGTTACRGPLPSIAAAFRLPGMLKCLPESPLYVPPQPILSPVVSTTYALHRMSSSSSQYFVILVFSTIRFTMEFDNSVSTGAPISVELTNAQAELLMLLMKLVSLLASDAVTDIQALPEVCRRMPVGSLRAKLTANCPSSVPQFVTYATKSPRRPGLSP
jgi:hypothetical protein